MLFIANWKSNKTNKEATLFFEELQKQLSHIDITDNDIVICPSFTALSTCADFVAHNNLPIKLGCQNISEFGKGAYTGEVNAEQVRELCEYVIIGHSERRQYLNESNESIQKKVQQALAVELKPILCVQDQNTEIPEGVNIVAYEPVFAIGSGTPDTPDNVEKVFSDILLKNSSLKLLYGGSINHETIHQFKQVRSLSGFLIGGASLSPESFLGLLS